MKSPINRDSVISQYIEGPAILERALTGLKESDLDSALAEGKWTIRQIVHHIVDGDDIWKTCIKQAIGNDQSEFSLDWYRALSQNTWADHWAYDQRPIEVSLTLLKAIRDHVVQLIEHAPDSWNRAVRFHEPNGEIEVVPVGFIIEMQADHVAHHVKQIEAILRQNLAPNQGI
jgi:uncharacterized damage-inducible protein DinB